MRPLLVIASLIFCVNTFAQNKTATVKGILIDSVAKQQLKSATINVLDKDSVLVSYAIAKEDGSFTVFNVPAGPHLLFVSFSGYEPLYKSFTVNTNQTEVNLGSVYVQMRANDLGNVTVKQSPVVIKQDTTEFNAGSFKTKPNASAEDLLKKMPGIQVEKDGTVKAQGESVKRVLVDGKRFFGDDPKMATKNLPTDMIDKIQVYDAQSDQSAFSGFDDGNREKTINIITKKDKRKGYFGKGSIGGGTDGRYSGNLNANRFNGNQQISINAQANNVNSQNFSIQDILGTMNLGGASGGNRGGGGGGMQGAARVAIGGMSMGGGNNFVNGGSSGITKTLAGGLNYNDVWSKNTSVNGSYFHNDINNLNVQDKFRETFTKDTSLYSTTNTDVNNKNKNDRFNFEIDQRIDSFNSILFRPSGSFQSSNNFTETKTVSSREKFYNINTVDQINSSENNGYNLNNSLLLRHKFRSNSRRSLSINLTQSLSNNESKGRTLAYTNSFNRKDTTDQLTNTVRESKNYGGNISYVEPMGKKAMLELSYNYNNSFSTSNQETQRMSKVTGKYDPYTPLTNNFENTNISHRVNANYRRQIDKDWNYTVGFGVQRSYLESENVSKNTNIHQWFTNYTPTLMIQYSKNRTKNLRLNYRGNTQAPSVTQLQPIQDITNQLNIRNGNPNLKQAFNHNFNLFYSRFDVLTFKNVFASLNGSFTQDKIGSAYIINTTSDKITVDGIDLIPGAQYSKPVNLNGGYNINGYFSYGFPVKAVKGNLNLSSNLSHSRDVNLINNVKSYTCNYSFGETIGFNMNIKDKFDLNLSSTSTYAMARYTQTSSTQNQNTDYFTQLFSIEPTYTTKNNFVFGIDFDYTKYTGQGEGFNQSIPLFNASISKLLFKNKAGELKLSAFDLLNQNKSITTNVDANYFESVRTTVLKRYVMLTFTYNLRKFGGGQQQMPGMFNMRQMGGGGMRIGGRN